MYVQSGRAIAGAVAFGGLGDGMGLKSSEIPLPALATFFENGGLEFEAMRGKVGHGGGAEKCMTCGVCGSIRCIGGIVNR